MAGLGIGPEDFALFAIDDPSHRAEALERDLRPKLQHVGEVVKSGLSRVAGDDLFVHHGKLAWRKDVGPEEMLVAFCESPRSWRGVPCLALAVTRENLHARIAVRGESPQRVPMCQALEREAQNLARKGKPFRKLRDYLGWSFEELPEIAPAHSRAFWLELADRLAPAPGSRLSGLDVGMAWSLEEARSLSAGDLLGTFRDLAPLYKVLANAAR